jgi:hypothetical protein
MHYLSRFIRSSLCATASVCVFPRSCTATTAHSLFAVLPMELRETLPCQCRGIRCSRCACVQQHVSQSTALKCPAGGEEEHTVRAVEVFRGMLRVWGTDQCQCIQVRLSLHVARDKLPVHSTRDSLLYRDYVVRVACVHVDVTLQRACPLAVQGAGCCEIPGLLRHNCKLLQSRCRMKNVTLDR